MSKATPHGNSLLNFKEEQCLFGATKTDEFSEMFQRGGSFTIQKNICRFCLDLQTGLLSTKLQYDFPKMRG